MTTSLCRGMSTSMFLRLCTRAPRTEIHSCAMGILDSNIRTGQSSAVEQMTAFHEFERAGWERAAEFYGDAFGGLTAQTAPALLDAARVTRGTRVLDVASGPGFIARAAADRGADVIGLDFAPAMVAGARRRNPGIDFRDGD